MPRFSKHNIQVKSLTEEQQADCCRRYTLGDTIVELAKFFRCSTQPIRNTLTNAGVSVRRAGLRKSGTITVKFVNPYTGCLTLSNNERVPHPGRKWKVGEIFLRPD